MRPVNTYASLYLLFIIVLLNCYQGIIALRDFRVVASLEIHLGAISHLVLALRVWILLSARIS